MSTAKTENTTIKQLTLFVGKNNPNGNLIIFVLSLDVRVVQHANGEYGQTIKLISEKGAIMWTVLPTYAADIVHDVF